MSNLIGMFMSAWLSPWTAMQQIKEAGDTAEVKSSMSFVVVMGLISGLITAVIGVLTPAAVAGPKWMVWLSIVIVPLVSFLGSFIGALIIWALVDGLLRGKSEQYWTSYRILALLAAFSPIAALLTAIPKVGQYLAIAVNVWATIVMIRGIIIVRNTPPVRTWITCGVLFSILFAIGVLARVAASQQALGGAGFNEFDAGAFGDEDLAANEDLDKQLQDLAEKAQSEPKK